MRLLRRDETKRRKSKCESLCGLWTLYLVVATLTVEEHSCNAYTEECEVCRGDERYKDRYHRNSRAGRYHCRVCSNQHTVH